MSLCKACDQTLVFEVEGDDGHDTTVPDDLLLSCGCHFHWYDLSSLAYPIHPFALFTIFTS